MAAARLQGLQSRFLAPRWEPGPAPAPASSVKETLPPLLEPEKSDDVTKLTASITVRRGQGAPRLRARTPRPGPARPQGLRGRPPRVQTSLSSRWGSLQPSTPPSHRAALPAETALRPLEGLQSQASDDGHLRAARKEGTASQLPPGARAAPMARPLPLGNQGGHLQGSSSGHLGMAVPLWTLCPQTPCLAVGRLPPGVQQGFSGAALRPSLFLPSADRGPSAAHLCPLSLPGAPRDWACRGG